MNEIVNDKVMKDGNGFLRADSILFSAGVMEYSDGKGGVVKAFMPPEEVEKSLSSFAGNPVTNDHPETGLVTPANYKELSVGYVDGSSLKFENGLVKGHVVVCSDDGVEALEGGKHDVSLGYREVKDFTPGVFIDEHNVMGEGHGKEFAYDYVKRDIRINHLALVDAGRSRAAELIFDSEDTILTQEQETICLDSTDFKEESHINITTKTPMTDLNKSIVLNDEVLEVSADAAEPILKLRDEHKATLIALDEANGKLAALKKKNEKLEEDSKNSETMKGELEALKANAKDAAEVTTDADLIASEAASRLSAWSLVNGLSNDSVEFNPSNTAVDTKRAFIAENYEVANIADASEAFLDGMLSVISKSSNTTVSKFVQDSAPSAVKTTPAQKSTIATDSFDDGSFGISLG